MKTHALFFLIPALICALFTAPAHAEDWDQTLTQDKEVTSANSPVNITADISSAGWDITIENGGSLTIKAGTTAGKLTLTDASKLTIAEGGILIIENAGDGEEPGELEIANGNSAVVAVENNGIIVLKGTLTNASSTAQLTSPGIILQYSATATPPAVAPSSGFVKTITGSGGSTTATIAVYGTGETAPSWKAWHNDFLNGEIEHEDETNASDDQSDPAYVGPPAQLTIGNDKELKVPTSPATTLTVKAPAYKIAGDNTSNYQLVVQSGGTLTLEGSDSKLDIQSSAQLAGGGTATITNSGGEIKVSDGGTFDIESKMKLYATGSAPANALTYTGGLTNTTTPPLSLSNPLTIPATGALTVSGAVTASGAITNNGAINIEAAAGNLTAQGNLSNSGTITNNKTLSISNLQSNSGTITNEGSGELTIAGGTINGNSGKLDVTGGTATITGTLNIANGGTTTIAAGGTLNVAAAAGNLDIKEGGILIIQAAVSGGGGGATAAGELSIGAAQASVANSGIIALRGKITNASNGTFTSPGIILKYSATADASSALPSSGFVKTINSATSAEITLCGTSPTENAWKTWHNDFLNGENGDYTTPAAQLKIESGQTLNVNTGVTLTANGNITNSGTIEVSGTGSLTSAGTLTNTGGTITGGGTLLSIKNGEITTIFEEGGTTIKSQGKINVTGGNATITGNLTIANGAQVNVSNSAQLTAEATAVIANSGEIKVTGGAFDFSDCGNVTNQPVGLIEITSPGTKTEGGKLKQGFLVNKTAQTIEVSGTGNIWTSALQEYITKEEVNKISLTCGPDRLIINSEDAPLVVPADKTLTIYHEGSGTPTGIAIFLQGDGTIDNTKAGALLALDGGLSLANNIPGWTSPQGFVQTTADSKTIITAYGNDPIAWSNNLQTAFSSAAELVVPQNSVVNFSGTATTGLTIPENKSLILNGTLICGQNSLTVNGTLYKGITGSIDDVSRISAGAGKINYEMNPGWYVTFPTNATDRNARGHIIVDGLNEGTHYNFTDNGNGTATLTGKQATDAGGYGYYGSFTRNYKAVTGVTLTNTANVTIGEELWLTKGRDDTTLVCAISPASGSVNQNFSWTTTTEGVVSCVNDYENKLNLNISPLKADVTTITVTSVDNANVTAQIVVHVTEPVTGVEITPGRSVIENGRKDDTTKLVVQVIPYPDANQEYTPPAPTAQTSLIEIVDETDEDYTDEFLYKLRVQEAIQKDTTVRIYVISEDDPTKTDTADILLKYVRVSNVKISTEGKNAEGNDYSLEKGKEDSLQMGNTLQLQCTVTPVDAVKQKVTWESRNTSVATVDATGKVEGKARGEAKIVVASEDDTKKTDTITIKVYEVAVKEIHITDKDELAKDSLQVGKTRTLTAYPAPPFSVGAGYTWTSKNLSVATVENQADGSGVVTAVSPGEADIIVFYSANPNLSDTLKVKVYTVKVEGVIITTGQSTTLFVHQEKEVAAAVIPTGATHQGITWSSGNEAVATVTPDGKITAQSEGVAYIYATTEEGGYKDSIRVTVQNVPVISVSIANRPAGDSLQLGSTWQLRATLTPTNASDTAVVWTSGDTAVARVDSAGLLTALSAGSAAITVTTHDGNKKETFTLKVYVVSVNSVKITNTAAAANPLGLGQTLRLTASVEPANANNKAVTWSSGNEAVATVSDDGLVTAQNKGETSIYVTAADGEKKDSVSIKVNTVPVSGVELSASADSLPIGATLQLVPKILPDGVNEVYEVTWRTSAPGIASVDGAGLVTGISAGEAQLSVTVRSGDREYKDTLTLKVYPIAASGVTIGDVAQQALQIGATTELTATVYPANATDKRVTWSSGDASIATVDNAGKVTAIAAGETYIYVTVADGGLQDSVAIAVHAIRVESVTIGGGGRLAIGATLQLTVTVSPGNATNPAVTWSSSDAGIASVDANGLVTGISAGDAVITATAVDGGGGAGSAVISVYAISVESVTLPGGALALAVHETRQLTATVSPANATDKSVVWRSGDANVATVDASGKVTAIGPGETYIYVTTVDRELTDSVAVSVSAIPASGVTIAGDASLSLPIGATRDLTANVLPANATNQAVTWSSSDEAVAAVSAAGRVTGVAAGEAIITVTTEDGGYKESVTITVHTVAVTGVTLASHALSLPIGTERQLVATVAPADATDKGVVWRSSARTVAAVTETGLASAIAAGEAIIYVTTVDGGYKDSVIVEVHAIPVEGVTIAGAQALSLTVGGAHDLTATVTPENATVKAITWRSGNGAVASVTAMGRVNAVSPGEATIYVTTEDGGLTDSIVVIVQGIPVESVTIAGAEALSLAAGATHDLTATVAPETATDKAVVWSSSDEAVAAVSATGRVTGVADGEAIITVTTVDGEKTDNVVIIVYTIPVPVTGVTIAGAPDSLATGQTLQLTAVVQPEGANVDYETAWESGAATTAAVDAAGLVTGVAEGSAVIYVTVTTADGVYKDSVTIAVYTAKVLPKITSVEIVADSAWAYIVTRPAGDAKGNDYGTLQLSAVITYTPADATIEEVVSAIEWSSADSTVATVDDAGLVTAVSEGIVAITLAVTEKATGEVVYATLNVTIIATSTAPVPASSVKAYIADNILYVTSAVAEKVDIYTISGQLLYSATKPAGEIQIKLTAPADGVLLIRGASGWVRKAVK